MGGKLQTIVLWFERKISLHSKNRGVCSGGGGVETEEMCGMVH